MIKTIYFLGYLSLFVINHTLQLVTCERDKTIHNITINMAVQFINKTFLQNCLTMRCGLISAKNNTKMSQ